jgi:hypothetical protein
MAHSQRLTEQVKVLTARIHELEAQVRRGSGGTDQAHSGVSKEEVDRMYEHGLSALSDGIGSLAIGVDGQAKYHGDSASSEVRLSILAIRNDAYLTS